MTILSDENTGQIREVVKRGKKKKLVVVLFKNLSYIE